MAYKVAQNWNNVAGYADILVPPAQPTALGWPDVVTTLDGGLYMQGYAQVELFWNNLLERTDMESILAQFGLINTLVGGPVASKKVTVRLLDNDDTWIDVNAIALAPGGVKRSLLGWRDFSIALTYVHLAT